jgi:hypothetical protein
MKKSALPCWERRFFVKRGCGTERGYFTRVQVCDLPMSEKPM